MKNHQSMASLMLFLLGLIIAPTSPAAAETHNHSSRIEPQESNCGAAVIGVIMGGESIVNRAHAGVREDTRNVIDKLQGN